MRIQHLVQQRRLVMEGETQMADKTFVLLFGKEIPNAEVVKGLGSAGSQIVQQEEVEIACARTL